MTTYPSWFRFRPTWHPECGTYAGHFVHVRAHEQPCDACRVARRHGRMQRARAGKCKPGLGWPLTTDSTRGLY